MVGTAKDLPENIGELQALVFTKDTLLREKDRRIAELEEQLQLLLHKRFGASSEKSPADQFNLFNEAEAVTNEQAEAAADVRETTVPEHKRKKPGRKALDKDLPRIVIEHDIPEEDKICGCGRCRPRIGQDMSEQLDMLICTLNANAFRTPQTPAAGIRLPWLSAPKARPAVAGFNNQ